LDYFSNPHLIKYLIINFLFFYLKIIKYIKSFIFFGDWGLGIGDLGVGGWGGGGGPRAPRPKHKTPPPKTK